MEEKDKSETNSGTSRIPNAWLVRLGDKTRFESFSVRVWGQGHDFAAIAEGDGFLVVDEAAGGAVAFGRVYRIRVTLDEVTFFLDGVVRLPSLWPRRAVPGRERRVAKYRCK